MDMTDIADDVIERFRQLALESARKPCSRPGPETCRKCNGPNDRRREGYATCRECQTCA